MIIYSVDAEPTETSGEELGETQTPPASNSEPDPEPTPETVPAPESAPSEPVSYNQFNQPAVWGGRYP